MNDLKSHPHLVWQPLTAVVVGLDLSNPPLASCAAEFCWLPTPPSRQPMVLAEPAR
jgi:hypothetical protein